MKGLATIAALVLLSGCTASVSVDSKPAEGLPQGTVEVIAPGGHSALAVPIKVNGVDCILVTGNGAKVAISCDWERK